MQVLFMPLSFYRKWKRSSIPVEMLISDFNKKEVTKVISKYDIAYFTAVHNTISNSVMRNHRLNMKSSTHSEDFIRLKSSLSTSLLNSLTKEELFKSINDFKVGDTIVISLNDIAVKALLLKSEDAIETVYQHCFNAIQAPYEKSFYGSELVDAFIDFTYDSGRF